jgi:hypothetical protein
MVDRKRFLELIAAEIAKAKVENNTPERMACWFVAWQAAEEVHQMSQKDVALMLQGGLPKIDMDYVDNWLATQQQDLEPGDDFEDTLTELFEPFFA